MPNLGLVFLTGLLTGGLTCLAVQGGLLATAIADDENRSRTKAQSALLILSFLTAKLIAYTILGAALGLAGSAFQLNITSQSILMAIVAVFMLGNALALLEVHPIFRYFILTPPRFLTRVIRDQAKGKNIFTPAILGAMTVFIPCGTTQAMMALAIGTGNPVYGALTLGIFVLGTWPSFGILGFVATQFKDFLQGRFRKIAGLAILVIAAWNLNGAANLLGSPLTLESMTKGLVCTTSFCDPKQSGRVAAIEDGKMRAEILLDERQGYVPDLVTIRAGETVKLKLVNKNAGGCIQAFVIPSLRVSKIVPVGTTQELVFKAPSKKGRVPFMCSMGMYRGEFQVI